MGNQLIQATPGGRVYLIDLPTGELRGSCRLGMPLARTPVSDESGQFLYVLADKEPRPGEHERFIRPLWKQGIGSTVHCIAGDATGIVAAAVLTSVLGLPMGLDLVVEYVAGFGVGLLVFQALFMKDMMGGSYRAALRGAWVPEWLSMNMMAAGMFPVMIFLMMGRDMRAMDPLTPQFWAVMSLGVTVGFFVAYPVNVWMVAKNLKHGLMTARPRPAPITSSVPRMPAEALS